ncbi:hypothetical protein BDV10DRAFT_191363 [Aspergillus recurvatus]
MGDPLSIASGVAGLLSLGIQVTQSLIDFYSAYKDQDSDLIQITQNLGNLLVIFTALDDALQSHRLRIDDQDLLKSIDKSIWACNEIIKELEAECHKFQEASATGFKGRIQSAGRRVAYPFRKSTLQKLEEDISEIRENLSLALDVLQLKNNNKLQEEISELKLLLERINATHISSAIRDWLMAPDATSDHNVACEKHHTGTGLWFIEGHGFKTWLVERNSLLWINGFAGCGKSVLCSTAIQATLLETQRRQDVGIAFFYFSFRDESKTTASGMLRALLLQLSAQLKDKETDLQQLHAAYKPGTPPVEALLNSLQNTISRFHDAYILLDALDESPRDRQREGVLKVIQAMRQWHLPGFHILVTSRDQLDIRQSLKPAYHQEIMMRNNETAKDIANFVSYQLSHDSKFQKWKARHAEIQDNLTKKSQGVFRYVECQLIELKKAKNQIQLDKCLHSLPRDLDETYERILCSIDEMYTEDVRRILTVLCVAKRPLTVKELVDAHAVDLTEPPHLDREGRSYDQDDLIDICLGLIEVAEIGEENEEKTSIARIAHFSVQEYLESDRVLQQQAMEFAIQKERANLEMAQICLAYLLEPELSNSPLDETRLTEFPLAHFAAMHWLNHFRGASGMGLAAEGLILRLFVDKAKPFLTWVQLHDLDMEWDTSVDLDRAVENIPSPVYYASLLGLESVLNALIVSLEKPTDIGNILNAQGGRYGNALQAASARGHEKIVQTLLDQGADVNTQGGYYGNALQAASAGGHKEVVQILLDQGANVNAQGGFYGNALQAASDRGYKKVVQILLDHGADINAQGGKFGHEKVVQTLLDQGALL